MADPLRCPWSVVGTSRSLPSHHRGSRCTASDQRACERRRGSASRIQTTFRTSPGLAFVAQGIEHRSPKAGVAGSNPAGGTAHYAADLGFPLQGGALFGLGLPVRGRLRERRVSGRRVGLPNIAQWISVIRHALQAGILRVVGLGLRFGGGVFGGGAGSRYEPGYSGRLGGVGRPEPGPAPSRALRCGACFLPASGVRLVETVKRLSRVGGVGVGGPLEPHRPVAAPVGRVQVPREGSQGALDLTAVEVERSTRAVVLYARSGSAAKRSSMAATRWIDGKSVVMSDLKFSTVHSSTGQLPSDQHHSPAPTRTAATPAASNQSAPPAAPEDSCCYECCGCPGLPRAHWAP